jgi:hypothetical protein
MNTRPENSKLVELRSKTDRQLVQLVTRKLQAAVSLAGVEGLHGPVERACEEVRRLLPFIPRADRRRLEARLQELGDLVHPSARAACF